MVNDKIGLGAWFKQVRIDRGFSLRQTASGFSAAALSRFERGQTDISQENLQKLMANLGLSALDLTSFELRVGYAFPTAIVETTIAQNVEAAQRLKNRYMLAHAGEDNNPLLPLAEKVFDMSMLPSNAEYRMDSDLENRLLTMLAYPNMWGYFERTLSVCCYRFASNDFLRAVWGYYQQIQFHSGVGEPDEIVWILYSAILHADWNLMHDIRTFISSLNEKERYGSINNDIKPMLHFLIVLSHWCDERDYSTYAKVLETLTMLRRLKYQKLADYFDNLVHYVQESRRGWDNSELELPPVNLVSLANKPYGVMCQLVREQRGLTMTEAALFWDKSTQSRLEAGTTQLGMSDAMVYSEMMLNINSDLENIEDSQPSKNLVDFFNAVNASSVIGRSDTYLHQLGESVTTNVSSVTSPWRKNVQWAVEILVDVGKHHFNQRDHMMVEQFLNQKACYFQDTILMQSVINQYSDNLNLDIVAKRMQQMLNNSSVSIIEDSTALFLGLIGGNRADLAIDLLHFVEERLHIVTTEGGYTIINMDSFLALAKLKLMPDVVHQFVAVEEALRQMFSNAAYLPDGFIQQMREVAPDVVRQSGIG